MKKKKEKKTNHLVSNFWRVFRLGFKFQTKKAKITTENPVISGFDGGTGKTFIPWSFPIWLCYWFYRIFFTQLSTLSRIIFSVWTHPTADYYTFEWSYTCDKGRSVNGCYHGNSQNIISCSMVKKDLYTEPMDGMSLCIYLIW